MRKPTHEANLKKCLLGASGICVCAWEDSANSHDSFSSHLCDQQPHLHRFSNTDSGFLSSQSHRCSSYSKRSSQQSSVSSHLSTQHTTKQSSSIVSEMVKSESISQNLQAESGVRSFQNFTQKVSSNSSISSTVTITSNNQSVDEVDYRNRTELAPPAIPQKTRRKQERQSSPYDNVTDGM